jgi:hypothetical protein
MLSICLDAFDPDSFRRRPEQDVKLLLSSDLKWIHESASASQPAADNSERVRKVQVFLGDQP